MVLNNQELWQKRKMDKIFLPFLGYKAITGTLYIGGHNKFLLVKAYTDMHYNMLINEKI
jgi:hypothetical protein